MSSTLPVGTRTTLPGVSDGQSTAKVTVPPAATAALNAAGVHVVSVVSARAAGTPARSPSTRASDALPAILRLALVERPPPGGHDFNIPLLLAEALVRHRLS